MNTSNESLVKRSVEALREFLLSVIVIDDGAEWNHSPTPSEEVKDAVHRLDAGVIAQAFADYGIVCGIIKPQESDGLDNLARVAGRADVVILDWSMFGDEGQKVSSLIKTILESPNARYTVRVIAIYTAEVNNLRSIVENCRVLLRDAGLTPQPQRDSEFRLSRGPISLSVFAKQYKNNEGVLDEGLASRIIAAADLPRKIMDEYVGPGFGLVENAALRASAQIRKYTHRLLARFTAEMDAGYLWHRVSQPDQEDAEDHVVAMIASEVAELVNADDVRAEVSLSATLDWVRIREAELTRAGQFSKDTAVTLAQIETLLTSGVRADQKMFPSLAKGFKQEFASFASSPADAVRSHEQLTMLMTLRDAFESRPPFMHAGTIVESADSTWLVCVQPLCDSVRIRSSRRFPFLKMEPQQDGNEPFNIVLVQADGSCGHFRIPNHPYNLCMITFPKPESGQVVLAETVEEHFVFKSEDRGSLTYRGELRAPKAQSVLVKLATSLSRPGLDDPEWLRRWDATSSKCAECGTWIW